MPCLQNTRNDKFQILCIGEKSDEPQDASPINTLYSLSNIQLYQKCITEPELLSSLVALGPDSCNLTECQVIFEFFFGCSDKI